jgi:hypothetical protein
MKAAQQLARKRWENTTEEERRQHAKMMSDAVKLTPAERKERAKKAAVARWARKKSEK